MLLSFNGKTMIEKVIRNITGSEVSNIMVVLGPFRDEILAVLKDLPVKYCYNESYRDGMLSSVRCGLRNLPESYDAALIFPGDQPLIAPFVTNKLIKAYRETGKGIIIPVYMKKRGHPLLVDKKYRELIYNLNPEKGLRSLAAGNSGDVLEVPVNTPGILKDIDTKEDYLNEINQSK
jgi:molybdenum cofactor cytidylyltransferase